MPGKARPIVAQLIAVFQIVAEYNTTTTTLGLTVNGYTVIGCGSTSLH